MSAPTAIKVFLRNTLVFSGRASRAEYWWPLLAFALSWFALSAALPAVGLSEERLGAVLAAYVLLVALPFLSAAARRLHDTGRSSKKLFVGLVPVVGPLLLLVWTASEGDVDFNRFGPPTNLSTPAGPG